MELLCNICKATGCICHKCLMQKNYDKCYSCDNGTKHACELCDDKNIVKCPKCNYSYCKNKTYEFDLSRLDELL